MKYNMHKHIYNKIKITILNKINKIMYSDMRNNTLKVKHEI